MPLIESISFTNQAINAGKLITFTAVASDYEMVHFKLWLYDLAALSSAKTTLVQIRRNGTVIDSRSNIAPAATTSATSVCLVSDLFSLSAGDILKVTVTGGATDTANVDIIAELFGILDLYAAIQTRATPADVTVNASVAVTAANAATLAAGNVAFTSYAHNSQVITSTSTEDLASATKVWFALKDSYQESDAQSLVFIEETAGLTCVGKSAIVAPIVAGDGSLTVTGSTGAWVFTVVLKSEAAALLADYAGSGKLGEVKATIGGNDIIIGTVTGAINSGVIRTNS